jgi:hypothetical protein
MLRISIIWACAIGLQHVINSLCVRNRDLVTPSVYLYEQIIHHTCAGATVCVQTNLSHTLLYIYIYIRPYSCAISESPYLYLQVIHHACASTHIFFQTHVYLREFVYILIYSSMYVCFMHQPGPGLQQLCMYVCMYVCKHVCMFHAPTWPRLAAAMGSGVILEKIWSTGWPRPCSIIWKAMSEGKGGTLSWVYHESISLMDVMMWEGRNFVVKVLVWCMWWCGKGGTSTCVASRATSSMYAMTKIAGLSPYTYTEYVDWIQEMRLQQMQQM